MTDRAADVAAFFDSARLTQARHLAGLRKSDLAALIGKSPTAVATWESGAKAPSPATVAELALGLSVDPAFFAVRQGDVAALSSTPHFRSLRSTSQIARDQAFAYGKLAAEIANSLEKHVEFPDPTVPCSPASVDDHSSDVPECAAQDLRKNWSLGQAPIRHLIRTAENHGVLVVFSPPQTAAVDAYSFDGHVRPVIIMNPIKRDYYRQRFDVAHELGHLVMHNDAEPGGRIAEEQANRFAAELLMPADQIREQLPASMGGSTWRVLARLKEHWGVSLQALLYRARQLGRLSDVSYRNAMRTISARGWRRNEPGNEKILEQPSLLPKSVELLEQAGITEERLVEQCSVPSGLFRTVTSRTPEGMQSEFIDAEEKTPGGQVFSLLDRKKKGK